MVAASSGPEAIDWHRRERIDGLVTDLVMPGGMNGYELAEVLRSAQPDLGVVYLSGHSDDVVNSHGSPSVRGRLAGQAGHGDALAAAIDSVLPREVGV